MACSFTLTHAGTAQSLYLVAQDAIAAEGGSLTGSPSSGSISMPTPAGTVKLGYTASGSSVQIKVLDKPWLVSCAKIQSELAAIVADVPAPEPLDVEAEPGPAFYYPQGEQSSDTPPTEIIFGEEEGSRITVKRNESTDMTKWLVAAGFGVAVLGAGYYLTRKRKPRRRTTRRSTLRA